jgi:hypothetical protein
VPDYQTAEYFQEGVDFVRSADYFSEIMEAFPEDFEDGFRRTISLDEQMR